MQAPRTALVLLLAFAAAACNRKPAAPVFTTVPVERGRVVARVTATGTLSALVTVVVGTQVSGRVAKLFVDFNSTVKKDEVLAKIDPQLFEAAVEQARANELQAEGQLAQAKAAATNGGLQLHRDEDLFAKKLLAQADLDTARATADGTNAGVKAAEGQLAQTKAQRHQAEVNLGYTTITSPIDGTVISRAVDVGQTVAASLAAPTLFTIAQDLSKMQVDTSVAEADVGKLQPGMSATFTVDAYSGEKFRGTIRQIRNAPQTVQNVVTYDAVIDVGNPDLKLRPGMTTNVTFVYATSDDVLKVPNAALRFKPPSAPGERGGRGRDRDGGGAWAGRADGGGGRHGGERGGPEGAEGSAAAQKTVYLLRDGAPVAVSITAGITDGSSTEVRSGALQEGDQVITDSTGDEGSPKPGGPGGGGNRMGRVF